MKRCQVEDPASQFCGVRAYSALALLMIFGADPPIHTPATITGTALSEETFQGGPEGGPKRSDHELHVAGTGHELRYSGDDSTASVYGPPTRAQQFG